MLRIFRNGSDITKVIAFNLDGIGVASGNLDGSVRTWEVETGTELGVFVPPSDRDSIPDPLETGELSILYGHVDWVESVAFT